MPYKVVAAEVLPWPHRPFKCGFLAELRQKYPGFDRFDDEDRQELFKQFVSSRETGDFARCSYHEPERVRAAKVAAELVEGGVNGENRWEVEDALPDEPQAFTFMVCGYFGPDAIRWETGSGQLTNGQHRTCALKVAGASKCVIATAN